MYPGEAGDGEREHPDAGAWWCCSCTAAVVASTDDADEAAGVIELEDSGMWNVD